MNLESESQFNQAFHLLGALLAQRISDHISLVICGGSALIALRLIARATKDVDVAAFIDDGELVSASVMPEALRESARLVALEMNLPADWLNSGPASIYDPGLPNKGFPEGFQERLTRRDFGPALSAYLASRYDQIFFKLYAAADQGGSSQHSMDLVSLDPSDEELLAAAKWARMHDPSIGFLETVRSMLTVMERSDVVSKL